MAEFQAKAIQGSDQRQAVLNSPEKKELRQYLDAVEGYKTFMAARSGGGSSKERNG